MLDLNKKTSFDAYSVDEFNAHVRACTACALSQGRTQVVVGDGPLPCEIMIVGEAPGEQEDEQGRPFVGRSGKLLTDLLEQAGIQRATDVYIANTVKCRPPENRTPLMAEIQACNEYLIRQIQLVKPRILLLVGIPAMRSILGEKRAISKVRGTWFEYKVTYMQDPLHIMPIFHPAYLLRQPSLREGSPKWLTLQDLQRCQSLMCKRCQS